MMERKDSEASNLSWNKNRRAYIYSALKYIPQEKVRITVRNEHRHQPTIFYNILSRKLESVNFPRKHQMCVRCTWSSNKWQFKQRYTHHALIEAFVLGPFLYRISRTGSMNFFEGNTSLNQIRQTQVFRCQTSGCFSF